MLSLERCVIPFLLRRLRPSTFHFDFPLSTVSALSSILLLVFSRAKKLDTEAELYDVALRALTRRPHSVHEMKKLLDRRASRELLAQVVMARLKENGLLDDSRYATQFARQRTEIRRQGQFRIARDLRARGIPDCHIEAAIGESTNDEVERAAVRQRIQRKLKLFRGPLDQKKIASLYGTLLRAGFSSDTIRRELKVITQEQLPDPVETDN
jgi:regulatory protein